MKRILNYVQPLLRIHRNNSNGSTGSEYIDEMFRLDYVETNSNTNLSSTTKNDLEKLNDLNYFDEILIKKSTSSDESVNNVTINDIKDFDFIDKTYFETKTKK